MTQLATLSLTDYKGTTHIDASYFFCPYIPGLTPEDASVQRFSAYQAPTAMQLRIMDTVRSKPMVH